MNSVSRSNSFIIGFTFILSLFIYFFTIDVFQFQFGGYDLSPLVDCAYRLKNDEIPYIDFINTLPLSMIGWMKITLMFIPYNWNFLLLSSLLHFYFVIFFILIIYFNTNNFENKYILFSLILISISIPIITTNHIWHSIFSQLNAVVVILSTTFLIIEETPKKIIYSVLFLFFGFLFFSKQNVGILICMSVFLIFFINNKFIINKKLFIISSILITSILFYYFLFLSLFDFSFSFYEIGKSFFGISGRAIPQINQLAEVFYFNKPNLVLLLLFAVTSSVILYKTFKSYKETLFVYHLIIQLIAYFAFFTDWDIKINNLPIIITSDLICLFFLIKMKDNFIFILISFITFIFLYSISLGLTRYRMRGVGYGTFFENTKLTKIDSGFFKGLNVTPKFISINEELKLLITKGDKLFFGPRMEWSYAEFNLKSPSKIPLWWHPGSSFSLKDTNSIFVNFKKNNFNKLIFLKDDKTRIPLSIVNYIDSENFYYKKQTKYLDIYYKINKNE